MLPGIREDGHPAERLTETFDAARGDVHLWSGARSQDRDQTVANRARSREKLQDLIGEVYAPKKPIALILVRDRPPAPDWDIVALGGCMI
jgi:hypothetical protein